MRWRKRLGRLPSPAPAAALSLVLTLTVLAAAPVSAAQVQAYGTNDFGGFHNVLPPGTNGLDTLPQLAQYETSGTRPPHNDDQLAMYSDLTTAAPGIRASQLGDFYKDATFGVPPDQVDSARTESPEPGVTIIRDSRYGVPHIYGETRPALMYGIGFASGEDRLFLIDVLRHYGRAELASFAGGANVSMDEGVWASEPYTDQDLQNQIDYISHQPYGQQVLQDATNYVAGLNAYISETQNPLFASERLPGEYAALGKTPQPFTLEDLVSIATLVGGIFGKGGGGQLSNALLYEDMARRFGPERRPVAGSPETASLLRRGRRPRGPDRSGFATFLSVVASDDPEAPTTVRGRRFPYQTLPRPSRAVLRTIALPDRASVTYPSTIVAGAAPSGSALAAPSARHGSAGLGLSTDRREAAAAREALAAARQAGGGLLAFPRANSNALLVSARHSRSGHALAVMGPQVAYFSPQILMEEDIHGPGVDADGAAFPGVNLYVELGHGRDYAWSATSSGQNIIDTFAVPLCSPDGGRPDTGSDHYLLHGQCVPMETLTRQESWTPNAADNTPPGSVTFQTQRTAFGIVSARGTVHGRPVAFTELRSTYMHELDSAAGFLLYNDPAQMRNPRDFFRASSDIGYTFNWFYVDDRHIAYFNSGRNPVRAPNTDPLFPTWSSFPWRGFGGAAQTTPGSLVESQTPVSAHPHTIDQSYLTSWNNKQAPGYGDPATGQEFSSVYRSQLLDLNLDHLLARNHGRLSLIDVVNAMGNAGTQDLRGVEVLPWALSILGHPRGSLGVIVRQLRHWVATGAHRINRAAPGPSGHYQQADAVRVMDAWWPLLVRADLGRVLGSKLLDEVESDFPINDEPGHGTSGEHLGSSWDVGFYGIVQKDLRAVLRRPVRGRLNRIFCGAGSLSACRRALADSLRRAAAGSFAQVYPADSVCAAGDQMCSDSIEFRPVGAVKEPLIEWVNRPTFQQAVEIQGHGAR